jgi:hypothetical protein
MSVLGLDPSRHADLMRAAMKSSPDDIELKPSPDYNPELSSLDRSQKVR